MREIEDLDGFRHWISDPASEPAALQGLDLRCETDAILGHDFSADLVIGCRLEATAVEHITATGGVVIPHLDGFAFETHRARLYSPLELFEGFDPDDPEGFTRTTDSRVHREYCDQGRAFPASILVSLARRLHDHSITDALMDLIEDRDVIAIMGGHGMERSAPEFAAIARVSRALTRRGFLMVSGGGPGAMEATHVGAWLAPRHDRDLDRALEILGPRPPGAPRGREYADPDWLHRAWRVRSELPIPTGRETEALSIGIPTWLYGHEPPTPFATHIAKYFANSVREDGLLAIARHGVIFAPGSAGTTQEIFQDAAQNHYQTMGECSPMILFGREYWTTTRPVWPLLEKVSTGLPFGELIHLSDDEYGIVEQLVAFRRHRK